jgi:Flp pilus assembly protein TadG
MKLTRNRGEAGMAMVETVIVLPILLMLFFAIVEFGIAFGRWQVVSNAAREGARRAVVFRDPGTCNPGTVEAEVDAAVVTYATSLGMTVGSGDVTVTGACASGPATVTVSVDHDFLFIDNFAPSVASSVNLVGTSTMRNE